MGRDALNRHQFVALRAWKGRLRYADEIVGARAQPGRTTKDSNAVWGHDQIAFAQRRIVKQRGGIAWAALGFASASVLDSEAIVKGCR